ncbi:hypothetical protein C8Q76DRAFT_800933 [Earliella scabrosa]|nr:hypothetical protein C8Q76DRAFT_800933 [Earliella scabrosa]
MARTPMAEPTAEALDRVTDLTSQLYYAWQDRPPVDSASRPGWDTEFTKTCKALGKVLAKYSFRELHPFTIGCIWEYNARCYAKTRVVDADAIHEAHDEWHPAFDPDTGRDLYYRPSQDGPLGLRAQHELKDVWWDKYIIRRPPSSDPEPSSAARLRPTPEEALECRSEDPDEDESHHNPTPLPIPHTRGVTAGQSMDSAVDGVSTSAMPRRSSRAHTPSTKTPSQVSSSGAAARKRKRSPSQVASEGEEDIQQSSAAATERLGDLPEDEQIPIRLSFPHGHGCDGCRKANATCEVETFAGTVCVHCRKYKIKCSFMQCSSKTLRCYLVWRLWKQSIDGQAPAALLLPELASDSAVAPDWWLALSESQGSRGRKRAKTMEPARGLSMARPQNPITIRAKSAHPGPLPASIKTTPERSNPHDDPSRAVDATRPAPTTGSCTSTAPGGPEQLAVPTPVRARRTRSAGLDALPSPSHSRASSSTGKGSSFPLRIPRLKGSWRDLPTLVREFRRSPSTPVPPVQSQSLESLSALPAVPPVQSQSEEPPPALSPTPPLPYPCEEKSGCDRETPSPSPIADRLPPPRHSAFEPGPATLQLVQNAEHAFTEVRNHRQLLEHAAEDAAAIVKTSRLRAQAALTNVQDPTSVSEALTLVGSRQMQLAIEQQKISEVLERVSRSLALICTAFQHLPPVPMTGGALTEMLDLLSQLRELYGTAQSKFDLVQEHLEPLRSQLQAVQAEQSAVSDSLTRIPNDLSLSIHPVLETFCRNIAQKLHEPLIGIVSLLRTADHPDEERRQLLERLALLVTHHSDMISSPSGARSEASGERPWDHILAIDARLCALEQQQGCVSPERVDDIQSSLKTMDERLTRLENAPPGVEVVQTYLSQFGLHADVLTRLGESLAAREPPFAFPGWGWGTGTK